MPENSPNVVVVDDDPVCRRLVAAILGCEGFQVTGFGDPRDALEAALVTPPHIAILDIGLPGMDGLTLLGKLHAAIPQLPVIMLTAHRDVSAAVKAIRDGAYDYLVKPTNPDELLLAVRRALERRGLMDEVRQLRKKLDDEGPLAAIVGKSEAAKRIANQIRQVASSNFTVLIQGETGTGKELVAQSIHRVSPRSERPFVAIDCGAIPEALMESELFGHEKGAFTGAERRRDGYLQMANGGTIFLDEVANLPLSLQAKLLRVLQERHVRPLGGAREIPIDVRVIAAANQSIEAEVRRGKFREDLYYRLAEFIITPAPLRERGDDVLLLARRFQEEACLELHRPPRTFADDALDLLLRHGWPGNVRQLRNIVRRAVLISTDPSIDADLLRPLLRSTEAAAEPAVAAPAPFAESAPASGLSLKDIGDRAVEEAERRAILDALRVAGGNKAQAARALRTDYKTLYVKMRRYQLESPV